MERAGSIGSGSENGFRPAYLELLETGELERRADRALELMRRCVLCARQCRVDRLSSLRGAACRIGRRARVHGHGPHRGEEAPISGWNGSGTIFLASCNMHCVFCQNWQISQCRDGEETSTETFAAMMLELQARGCHNINLVSPSHVVAQILGALVLAARRGLRLPLVFNSGGYDSLESLELLDGVIDVYMPDMKWGDSKNGRAYSHVRNYVAVNRAAVREMHRQVGVLRIDDDGIARRGLLVRHLVLPGGLSGTGRVMKFVAEEISPETYVNLMDQYRPSYKAAEFPPLDRPLTEIEYRRARAVARRYGIERLDGTASRFC